MALNEAKWWVIRKDIQRNDQQDAADAVANGCDQGVQGWSDQQIIDYRESQNPPLEPSLLDGWIRSEFFEDQDEVTHSKRVKKIKAYPGPEINLNLMDAEELEAWIEINQETTFKILSVVSPSIEVDLLITNKSGSAQTITFSDEFLVDHEPQLLDNNGLLPNNFGAYLHFKGLPNKKMLLTRLLVRSIL